MNETQLKIDPQICTADDYRATVKVLKDLMVKMDMWEQEKPWWWWRLVWSLKDSRKILYATIEYAKKSQNELEDPRIGVPY